jgi:acetyl-CoA decarbonylase/synthase complex subunit gamma
MALKGLDIFKMTPKSNCKECGFPTCMAFSMKVAQGGVEIDKCPHIPEDKKAELAEATAPPMKTLKIGVGDEEHQLGGETVLYRHEKTFVSKTLFAVKLSDEFDAAKNDERIAAIPKVEYERIGERMYVELVYVKHVDGNDGFIDLVKKADGIGRTLIIDCKDEALAKEAVELVKDKKPILNGANASNYEAMNTIATEAGVTLGVSGADLNEIHDTLEKLQGLGNKNMAIDVGTDSIKQAFENCVQIRRTNLKGNDRVFGYPSIVNVAEIVPDQTHMQGALAALFTMKYGSIVVLDEMNYAIGLAVYGLRQNLFTDPQKPMTVEPKIYPLNGADENAIVVTTVDFALTYFVVTGELERSGVPCNLVISDAGGMSVLTAWAAGKLSAGTIAKFFEEQDIPGKLKSRKLIIPGKVAVLKGELEAKLPDWEIIVAPNEAVQLVKFMKELSA